MVLSPSRGCGGSLDVSGPWSQARRKSTPKFIDQVLRPMIRPFPLLERSVEQNRYDVPENRMNRMANETGCRTLLLGGDKHLSLAVDVHPRGLKGAIEANADRACNSFHGKLVTRPTRRRSDSGIPPSADARRTRLATHRRVSRPLRHCRLGLRERRARAPHGFPEPPLLISAPERRTDGNAPLRAARTRPTISSVDCAISSLSGARIGLRPIFYSLSRGA